MFKSFYYVKNIFLEINEELKSLYKKRNELNERNYILKKTKEEIEITLIKEIDELKNKISKLNLLNNCSINFNLNDFTILFDSDYCYQNSFGFNYKNDKKTLFSNSVSNLNIKYKKIDYDYKNKTVKIEFDDFQKINFFQFNFLDIDSNPIVPISIYYNDNKIGNELIDKWNKKITKEQFNEFFVNSFYIDPKEIKYIFLKFEEQINLNNSNINFYYNIYELNSEITYSFPIKELNGFLLKKSTFEEYVNLDFYYSFNNKDYKNLYFENNISRCILEKKETITSLYIKIKRGKLIFNNNNKKISFEQKILNSKDLKEDDITFNLNIKENFNMIVDNNFYISYKDILPDLFNKRIDGLIEIKQEYIKEISEINPIQRLQLKNSNNIKIYNNNNYPIFYLDKNRYLYLPSCLAEKDFNIIYEIEINKDVFAPEDFTPICFNFNLNFI